MADRTIRILATAANERGDLFARLVTDVFLALGYSDRPRLNIQKAGREIDVTAAHRTERRIAIAECKALAKQVGGSDLNKFAGVLDAERKTRPSNEAVQGYFLSLSGFTETGLQQEEDAGGDRFILFDADAIVHELVEGRILVSEQTAIERAGRLAAQCNNAVQLQNLELVAHPAGFLWVVVFAHNLARSHFALVHAGGELVDQLIADDVIARDRDLDGDLHELAYLAPPSAGAPERGRLEEVRTLYEQYVQADYGMVTLEGLPADQQAGSRQLRLEDIFVPLHLSPQPLQPPDEETNSLQDVDVERDSVGRVLSTQTRIAVLGSPGSGKSTLIKRLATAYTAPQRRSSVTDDLPDRDWLPLVLRCRQLDRLIRAPLLELVGSIAARAEFPERQDDFDALGFVANSRLAAFSC
jgi:ABC-type multidrug transport system fused ATPase/permease subunit